MSFAAKLKKNETIKITAQKLTSLTITNIALAPHQQKASLLILAKQTQEKILVVKLKRDLNSSYSCAIKFLLDESHYEQILAQHGEIHIIGNIQPIHPPQHSQDLFANLIAISRKDHNDHGHVEKKEGNVENAEIEVGKAQGRPKRSVNFKANTTIQPKVKPKNQDNSNSKKQKSLLDMMKNIDKQDSQESDDQSYEQESQEDDSDESQSQEQEQQTKKSKKIKKKSKNLTKKSSWAQMLHKEMEAQSGSDSQEESEQDQEQLDDKTAKMATKKETRKVIPAEKKQKASSQVVSTQKTKKSNLVPQNGDEDSSSFQFTIPSGLPNFLKNE